MSSEITDVLGVWAIVAVNFPGFFLGVIITGLSYHAYQAGDNDSSLRNATVGFGFITLGIVIEPLYQLGIEGTHVFASEQNITLQLVEAAVFSTGLLILFFSIYRYNSHSKRQTITVSGIDDELFEDLE